MLAARIGLLFLLLSAVSSRAQDLATIWKKTIDNATFGLPGNGSIPPSIWALAFSVDGKYLAAGLGFIQSPKPPYQDHQSYISIIQTDQPDSPWKLIPTSIKPWSNHPAMSWNADGKYIVVDHTSLLVDNAFLFDVEKSREALVPRDECRAVGVIAGPRVVMYCSAKEVMRLVRADGTIESEWGIGVAARAGFAIAPELFALAIDPENNLRPRFREFGIFRAPDHSEAMHWTFAEGYSWSGALSPSGSVFCGLFYQRGSSKMRTLTFRDVAAQRDIGSVEVNLGSFSGRPMMVSDNGLVVIDDGSSWIGARMIWDVPHKRRVAKLPVRTQNLLPKSSWPAEFLNAKVIYADALSPDGSMFAEGGSGEIRLFRVPRTPPIR